MKDAQNALAELDKQTSQELANAKSENDNLRMLLTALAGCASSKPISRDVTPTPTPQAEIPAPAAWAMQPPSNSLQLLQTLFLVSEKESSATKQN